MTQKRKISQQEYILWERGWMFLPTGDKKMEEKQICSQCETPSEMLRSLVYKNVKTDEEDSYLSDLCHSCFEQAVDLISQSDEIAPFCIECHSELKIPEELGKGVECQC